MIFIRNSPPVYLDSSFIIGYSCIIYKVNPSPLNESAKPEAQDIEKRKNASRKKYL